MPVTQVLDSAQNLSRRSPRSHDGRDAGQVLQQLSEVCRELTPGAVVPRHTELMKQLDAPERAVRWALGELHRQGLIVRRHGARTVVADPTNPALVEERDGIKAAPSQTIVAIAEPDGSIFDRALQLLARHPKAAQISMNCRLIAHREAASFELPSAPEKPLGYLIFRHHFEPLAQRLQAAGHRVVLIGQPSGQYQAGVPNVCGDHEEGGALLAQHLLELGHRRLLLQGNRDFFASARWRGIHNALEASGFSESSALLSEDQYVEWARNPALVSQYFARPDAPTALLAWNDENAFRLLTLLHRAGVRVPEDVSLVGYDDLPQSAGLHPALTTVDTAIERQLNTALRLLTQAETPSPHLSVVVLPKLVRRDSSAPVSLEKPPGKEL